MKYEKHNHINVLWVTSWYPNMNSYSNGDFIMKQAQAVSLYANVKVICVFENEYVNKIEICKTNYNNHLEEIIAYIPKKDYIIFSKFINIFRTLLALNKVSKTVFTTFSPDIIHNHVFLSAGIWAFFYAKWNKLPHVITEHSSVYFRKKNNLFWGLYLFVLKFIASKTDCFIVVSDFFKKKLLELDIKSNFIVIPNVIDQKIFCFKKKKVAKSKIFKWIHTSTMNNNSKNIYGILDAISLLSREKKDFVVHFFGGSMHLISEYYSKSIQLGIEKFVIFEQEIKQSEIAFQLASADAYVSFSNYETFGLSVLEALIVGLPCVTTDTGNFKEWINENTGKIISIGDTKSLTLAIIDVMTNYDTFNTADTSKKILEQHSYSKVAKEILNIYHKISKRVQ